MKVFGFPLFDEATDTPDGGGASAVEPPEANVVDDSDLEAQFNKLSGAGGDAHSAADPPEKTAPTTAIPSGQSGAADSSEAPTFDADLLDRARLFGLDDEEINTHADPAELERTLLLMGKRLFSGEPDGQEQATRQEPPPANKPASPQNAETPTTANGLLSLLPKEVQEELDPSVVKVFESIDKENASIKQELQELRGLKDHFDRQHGQQVKRTFDEATGALGEEFAEIYGNGDPSKLSTAQFQKRAELWDAVQRLSGDEGLTTKSVIKQVAIALNADHYQKHLTRQLSARAKNNHRGSRVLPNSPAAAPRQSAPVDGVDAELVDLFNRLQSGG